MNDHTKLSLGYFAKNGLMQHKSLLILLLVFAFACAITPDFLTARYLIKMLQQTSIIAIMALGMMLVMLTATVDLSVGSLLALTGAIAVWLLGHDINVVLTVLLTLAAGVVIGAVNGLVAAKGGVYAFIGSFIMWQLWRFLALILLGGTQHYIKHTDNTRLFINIDHADLLGMPLSVWLMVLLFFVGWYLLHHHRTGRYVYARLANPLTVRWAGITFNTGKIIAYSLCGLMAALAGMILLAHTFFVSPASGTGYEIDVIAAVLLGGSSPSGGKGRIIGTLIGALIIGFLVNVLNILEISDWQQTIIKLMIILLIILFANPGQATRQPVDDQQPGEK